MEKEDPKKVESETPSVLTTPPQVDQVIGKAKEEEKAENDIYYKDKILSPLLEEKPAPVVIHQKIADSHKGKNAEGPNSTDRDAELARVETQKKLALIKAWEESEKTKAENKNFFLIQDELRKHDIQLAEYTLKMDEATAYKKLSAVAAWENSRKASVEAQLKKIEEKLEKKKAESTEKMKNKMAEVHKAAEEKKAMVEAKRREEFLKVEETASKFRASGYSPKKLLACFSS